MTVIGSVVNLTSLGCVISYSIVLKLAAKSVVRERVTVDKDEQIFLKKKSSLYLFGLV